MKEAKKMMPGTIPPIKTRIDDHTSASAEKAAPKLINGAIAQRNHETLLGLVRPLIVSIRYLYPPQNIRQALTTTKDSAVFIDCFTCARVNLNIFNEKKVTYRSGIFLN